MYLSGFIKLYAYNLCFLICNLYLRYSLQTKLKVEASELHSAKGNYISRGKNMKKKE